MYNSSVSGFHRQAGVKVQRNVWASWDMDKDHLSIENSIWNTPQSTWMSRYNTYLRPQFQETTGKTSQDHLWFCLVLKHTSFLFELFQFTGIVKFHLIQLTIGYCWIHLALLESTVQFSFFFHPTSHGFLVICKSKLGNLLIQDWTYTCYAFSCR